MQKMHRMQLLHLLKRRKAFSTFFLHIFQLFFFIFQFFCWYSWFIYAGWCRDAAPASLERCIAHMRMPAFFGRSPASDAARHRMPLLVNAKPKKVPASSYVRCHDAAPFSNRPNTPHIHLKNGVSDGGFLCGGYFFASIQKSSIEIARNMEDPPFF